MPSSRRKETPGGTDLWSAETLITCQQWGYNFNTKMNDKIREIAPQLYWIEITLKGEVSARLKWIYELCKRLKKTQGQKKKCWYSCHSFQANLCQTTELFSQLMQAPSHLDFWLYTHSIDTLFSSTVLLQFVPFHSQSLLRGAGGKQPPGLNKQYILHKIEFNGKQNYLKLSLQNSFGQRKKGGETE